MVQEAIEEKRPEDQKRITRVIFENGEVCKSGQLSFDLVLYCIVPGYSVLFVSSKVVRKPFPFFVVTDYK